MGFNSGFKGLKTV